MEIPIEGRDTQSVVADDIQIPEPYPIEITGSDYRWRVCYPGIDGLIGTSDDVICFRDFHLPAETHVRLTLKSTDYVYSFALPEFKKREIAVPNLEFHVDIRANQVGTYALEGDEFCGDPHPELTTVVIVESREQFRQWLGRQQQEIPNEPGTASQSASDARRLK